MKVKNPIILYFRSNLNISILVVSALFCILFYIILPDMLRIIVPASIIFLYLAVSIYFISTKSGVKEIIKENEEERLHKVEEIIKDYIDIRDTISYLRINDGDIRKVIEYFLLVSGNYLNKCKELNTYSPESNNQIQEALKICQIYLEELDETVTEEQYGIKDSEDFSDYKKRTINSITACSNTIKAKTQTELSGLTRSEQMEIIEEMDDGQV